MPEGLLLVVWSFTGLWVVGWVGLGSEVFTLRWVGLGWVSRLVGWLGLKKLDPRITLTAINPNSQNSSKVYELRDTS